MRLWKRYTWLGGVRTPMIVSWPAGIDPAVAGSIRSQFCHAVDVTPTLLDLIGIDAPEEVDGVPQQPMAGSSLVPTFADADAPDPRSTQYFEMLGSRAIFHDGWKATTDHVGNQLTVERELVAGSHEFDDDHWALFDLRTDFSESTDVSGDHPEVVDDLQRRWWAEAEAHNVLPLDDSLIGRAVALEPNPNPIRWQSHYRPGGGPIAEDALPGMGGGFRLHADIDATPTGSGVVSALGDWNNGWALYLLDGRPAVAFNLFGDAHVVRADDRLPGGTVRITVDYRRRHPGGGPVALLVDDVEVGATTLPIDLPFRWQIGGTGLRLGADHGFPVCDDYAVPFSFDGTVHLVTIEIPAFAPRPSAADDVARALHRE